MPDLLQGIGSSLTALVTPFKDTKLDLPTLARLAARQVAHGTTGPVVCDSTGETQSLSITEFAGAIAVVAEGAAEKTPVIAGCTAASTTIALALAEAVARAGPDGLLCAVPPDVEPMQEGIIAHVRAIAHTTDLPVVLYGVPSRSSVAITDDTVTPPHDAELIVGLKDATANLSRSTRLRARCGGAFMQWSSDDATAPAQRAMGGTGCVSVTATVTPALRALMHRVWDTGNVGGFAALRDMFDPLHAALFNVSNPIPVEAALASLGLCTDDVRWPPTRVTLATRKRLLAVMPHVMLAEKHAAQQPIFALAS